MEKAGFVIDGGRLINGTGRAPSENTSLLIRNGEIVEVSAGSLIGSDEEEVIDAHGKTIMPGLIDAHMHFCLGPLDPYRRALEPSGVKLLRGVQNAKRMIEAGFTTARDVGGLETIYLKRGIQEGLIPGPRILAARLVITQTAGHADIHFLPVEWNLAMNDLGRLADGPNECRKAVREQMREGADLIKICSTGGTWSERDLPQHRQFTMDELHAIVDEAHAWDKSCFALYRP